MKFWRRGNHQSIMNHLEVNTQKVFIMLLMGEFQDTAHFIIINEFNCSGVCIWNWFRVKFNRKIWRVNLIITIINDMMTESTYDSWNHWDDVGRRGSNFEVIWWRLYVPLSWWFILFSTMKGVELINISYMTWWEEFKDTDSADIRLLSNPSTSFANTLLFHA